MKKFLLTLGFLAILAPASSFATDFIYDGSSQGLLTQLRYQPDRILLTQQNATNPGGCTNTTFFALHYSSAGFWQINAAILTAYTKGSSILLLLSGCDENGSPVIQQAVLQ